MIETGTTDAIAAIITNEIAKIILIFLSLVLVEIFLIKARRNAFHILQLENYHRDRYAKWIKENKEKSYPFFTMMFALIPLLFCWNTLALLISQVICLICICLITKKKKEKKPLVVTGRIKREYKIAMMVWLAISVIILIATIMTRANNIVVYVTALINLLTVCFAFRFFQMIDLLHQPIQNRINNKFITNAKNKISEMPNLTVIGITGSYGKTSTKNALQTILSEHFNSFMTPGNFNTEMGVTRTVNDMLKPVNDVFVCEMGAMYRGDIKAICDIVKPKIAIITAVGPMHLNTFKSIENVKKTKFELVDSLPEDGIAFLNWEDENVRSVTVTKPHIKYGLNDEADYYATNIEMKEVGSEFEVVMPSKEKIKIRTKLLGNLNILNIVCAVAVANTLGMTAEEIQMGAKKLQPVEHRLELKRGAGESLIIDDAYNSNVKGSKMALEVLSGFKDRKRILITPGIIDLGEKADEYNKELGKYAADKCDIVILVGEKQAEPIKAGLLEAGMLEKNIRIAENINVAITMMSQYTNEKSVVLFENDLPDNYL